MFKRLIGHWKLNRPNTRTAALPIAAIVILIILVLGALAIQITEHAIKDHLAHDLMRETTHTQKAMETRLKSIQDTASGLARNEMVISKCHNDFSQDPVLNLFFRSLMPPIPNGARIAMTDARGNIIIANGQGSLISSHTNRWTNTLTQGEDAFVASANGMTFTAPIISGAQIKGAIVIEYGKQALATLFASEALIMSDTLWGTDESFWYSNNSQFIEAMPPSLDHPPGWLAHEADIPNYPGITLVIAEPFNIIYAQVDRLTNVLVAALIMVTVSLWVIFWCWERFVKRRLIAQTLITQKSDLDHATDKNLPNVNAKTVRTADTIRDQMAKTGTDTALSQNRVDNILNSMSEILIVTNSMGDIVTLNPAAKAFANRRRLEAPLRVATILRPNRDIKTDVLAKFLQLTGPYRRFDAVYDIKSETQPIAVRWSKSILYDPDGSPVGIIIIGQDVTELIKEEKQKDDFISTVSHELRTPLTSINGSLALLSGGVAGDLSKEALALLNLGQENARHLLCVINDLLDLKCLDAGGMTFDMEPVRVIEAVKQTIDANQGVAKKYSVSLQFIAPFDTERNILIHADRTRFVQVVTNLLSNACKFSPEGGIVTVGVGRSSHGIVISVTDNGPGIPEGFKDKIFNRFAQSDCANTRKKGGTGLGLSLVKLMTERMGGEVWFTNNDSGGATFFIRFPDIQQQEASDMDIQPVKKMA